MVPWDLNLSSELEKLQQLETLLQISKLQLEGEKARLLVRCCNNGSHQNQIISFWLSSMPAIQTLAEIKSDAYGKRQTSDSSLEFV